jgi:hypothetical protein
MLQSEAVFRQAVWPLLWVAGAILLLAVGVYWVRVWLRDGDGPAVSFRQMLAEYEEMNRRGELSDEEYRIIKSRFAPRSGRTAPTAPGRPEDEGKPEDLEKDCRPGNP